MTKEHVLKILPEYFEAQKSGKKAFEIRKNDRNYKVGDYLKLNEYDPKIKKPTGRAILVEITYITDYQQKDNYVVLGTRKSNNQTNTQIINDWRKVIHGE